MARRLLITGASGTLGGPLAARAVASGWDVRAAYLTHPERVRAGEPVRLDLRHAAAVIEQVRAFAPQVIIHAAVTERSGPGYADAIRLAGAHIAQAAQVSGARLIALSTDLIFDGSAPLYDEATPPRPHANSEYGRAKLDAERLIRAACPDALIVRTSLIYDFDPQNAQVAWMLRQIERGEPVRLYVDQIRCPIWVRTLADALLELAEGDSAGVLNVAGPQPVSRCDLGAALLDALGVDAARWVIPAPAPDSAPRRLALSVDRARALLHTPLLTLTEARAQWAGGGSRQPG